MSESGPIQGHHRVAALLLGLDGQAAAALLKHMSEEVVAKVAAAMIDLDPRLSEPGALDGVYRDLALHLNGPQSVGACDSDELAAILGATFGKSKGDRVVQQILDRRQKERPFLTIEGYSAQLVARALVNESAVVSALVLGHVAPAMAADVLKLFEDETAAAIIHRMATFEPPAASVMRTIATDLEERIGAADEEIPTPEPSDRLRSIAEVLNYSSPEIEKQVIESLSEDDADMANELREYMFTWEDIATIDRRAMQKILGTVDTKTLSLALKASSAPVEENVLGNLSTRVREMVSEERDLAGAVPMGEVETARNEIMRNIRAMIEAGEFSPSRAGEDLVS